MSQPLEVVKQIHCVGVALDKGFPLEKPIRVTVTTGPKGSREVQCPLKAGVICTAAELGRVNCIQERPDIPDDRVILVPSLSKAEMPVAILTARGLSNDEIAGRKHNAVDTIKTHQRSILRKFRATDREQYVAIAIDNHVIQLDMLAADFDFTNASALTPQELAILAALSQPTEVPSNNAIDARLNLPEGTAKKALAKIARKHGTTSRGRAVSYNLLAQRVGVIPASSF